MISAITAYCACQNHPNTPTAFRWRHYPRQYDIAYPTCSTILTSRLVNPPPSPPAMPWKSPPLSQRFHNPSFFALDLS